MIKSLAVAGLLMFTFVGTSHAGFELQAALRGAAPTGATTFTTGGALATSIELDLFLVENTNASFSTTGAIFNLSRIGGPATTGSNLAAGFGIAPPGGSDPTFTFTNAFGSASSLSAGGLAYVKVGQIDILPSQDGGISTFQFVANNPTAEQFTINGSNLSSAAQQALFTSSGSFTVAVPEPSGIALLSLGVVGLAIRRKRT